LSGYLDTRIAMHELAQGVSLSSPHDSAARDAIARAETGPSGFDGVQFFTAAESRYCRRRSGTTSIRARVVGSGTVRSLPSAPSFPFADTDADVTS